MKFNKWFLISSTAFLALVQSAVAYNPDTDIAAIDAQIKSLKVEESKADRKAEKFARRAAKSRANCNYNREDIRIRKRDAADLDASRYRFQISQLENQRYALMHPQKETPTDLDSGNPDAGKWRDPNGLYDADGNVIGFVMSVSGTENIVYGPGQGPGKYNGPGQGPGKYDQNDDVVYVKGDTPTEDEDGVVEEKEVRRKSPGQGPKGPGQAPGKKEKPKVDPDKKPKPNPDKPKPGINDRGNHNPPTNPPKPPKRPGQGPGQGPGKRKGPGQGPDKVDRTAWDNMVKARHANEEEARKRSEEEARKQAEAEKKKIQDAIDAELKKAQEEHQEKVDACSMTVIKDKANYRVRNGQAVFKGKLKLETCEGKTLQTKKKVKGQDGDVVDVLNEFTNRPAKFMEITDKAVSNKVDKTVLHERGNDLQYSENLAEDRQTALNAKSAQ